MKKLNIYHTLGLLCISVFLASSRVSFMPEFIKGCLAGTGIFLTLIGVYAYNHDISKLKKWKIKLLKSFSAK